ncbi:hypothetical protein QYE77_14950 (plasmid) [Thermanaerothrix sp. 4228-RoL]|jgi:hypothetical protein|uniref:Uncharacterized protein n=1 Tax=Thermanaerothrix solaris TaxID=3058434 RepID=A0ABU3NRV2_9CHLR|nr:MULTISPECIES: hypothetical protein [unclassified Thermanaerothrix]MDT8899561.1 hypothetical protein [Thermanaerothrix sp. 4228-RoL]
MRLNLRDPKVWTLALFIVGIAGFEVFNYGTTLEALRDILGRQGSGAVWAVLLSLALCAIDFAGVARLFIPEDEADTTAVWLLFGVWALAAAVNAVLTWWSVSLLVVNHTIQGAAVVGKEVVQRTVPIVAAVLVFSTRLLLVGALILRGLPVRATRMTRQIEPEAPTRILR